MTLFIQKDESIRSFVARSLYLFPYADNSHDFAKILRRKMHTQDLRFLASVMGWEGCYGFNKLVHNHCEDTLGFIFKSARDFSYSQKWYIEKKPLRDRSNYSFCPLCVREDVSRIGYSYWRRWWSGGYDVCGTHNVVLQKECPHCKAPFTPGGHNLDVMWAGCSGRPLTVSSVEFNSDATAYHFIKFHEKACEFEYYIPLEIAVDLAARRLEEWGGNNEDYGASWRHQANRLFKVNHDNIRDNNARHFSLICGLYISSIQKTYSSFDELTGDVFSRETATRSIETLWSTYQASGSESACFIEEEYNHSVGLWSCPHPSVLSNNPTSRDGWDARTPKIYSCCNFFSETSLTRKPKAKKVSSAAPAIISRR
ncbi:hypothetical protein ACIP01_11125 [Pseudomonas monteilii]|uniref:hypothetical protein n=1 Tax=Pseudomonas monteilii TaxID=76759 RepID=UPI003804105A